MYRTNAALENNNHCSFFVEEIHVIYFEIPTVNLKCRLFEYNDTCICSCTGYLGSTKVDAVCDKLSKVNYDYEVRTNQCIVLQIGYDYEPINALSYRSATTMNRSMHCQLRL